MLLHIPLVKARHSTLVEFSHCHLIQRIFNFKRFRRKKHDGRSHGGNSNISEHLIKSIGIIIIKN